MKRLALICPLLCVCLGLMAQLRTVGELEELIGKQHFKSAYRLTNDRITALLKTDKVDTLSYYMGYLGTLSNELKGLKAAEREMRTALDRLKKRHPHSAELPGSYLAIANFYSREGENAMAYGLMQELLAYFKGKERVIDAQLSNIHNYLGTFAMRMGNNGLSSAHYRESLRLFRSKDNLELYRIYNSMGIVMWNASKVDSALHYMLKAIQVLDSTVPSPLNRYHRRAMVQGNISNVYWELGKAEESIKNAEWSIDNYKLYSIHAENEHEKEKGLLGYYMSLFNLGSSYQDLGNYGRALELLNYSYNSRIKHFGTGNPEAYKSLVRIGTIYYAQKDYKKAMQALKRAFDFWSKEETSVWLANAAEYLAYTYEALDRKQEALRFYVKADSLYKAVDGEDHNLQYLQFLTKQANFYAGNGQTEKAVRTGEKSVAYAIKSQGERSLLSVAQLRDMSKVHFKLGNYQQALKYSERALGTMEHLLGNSKQLLDSIAVERYRSSAILYQSKAKYHLSARKDRAMLEQLLSELYEATEATALRKSILSEENDIRAFIEDNKELTDFIKQLYYELYLLTDNKGYIDRILHVHEAAVYTRIRSRMDRQKTLHFAHLPGNVQAREEKLKENMQTALKANGSGDATVRGYREATKEWTAFQQSLKQKYPAYYNMRYASAGISLKELGAVIPDGMTLVRYIFSDGGLFALVASRQEQVLVPLSRSGIEEKIKRYAGEMGDFVRTAETTYALYQQLWQPLEKAITNKRVIIIPDGVLYGISFEMLTPIVARNPVQLSESCLLNRYAISYHYSPLALNHRRGSVKMKGNFVAFAPGFSDIAKKNYLSLAKGNSVRMDRAYLSLLPLPFTSRLVQAVKRKFGGNVFSDQQSTAAAFRKESAYHHIIHLGTHAEANNDHPEYSRLIFSKDDRDPMAENSVYLYDIYGLDLTANLSVITACESGKPGYEDGEGMISMAHAFSYAGSRSIMTGLWKLDEQATAQITAHFYANLEAGMPKDIALQKAKLHYIQQAEGRMLEPTYWAGLAIMGDPDSIELNPRRFFLYYIVGGILLLCSTVWLWRKKWGRHRKKQLYKGPVSENQTSLMLTKLW